MQVLGWSPTGEYEEVDVQTMFQTPVENWYGQVEPCFDKPDTILGVNYSTPPSLPSTSSTPPEYKAMSPRRRDPEHIPRPRNSFIIFRCDYTRQHCYGSDDCAASSQAEKRSLSKRAGEAWKNVSPETKKYYKKLADMERDAHAKRNPDYRFRPRRRKAAKPVQSGTKERVNPMPSPQIENSRSRSSSLSSVGSSIHKTISKSSVPPTPSSVRNLSWSQPSSPEIPLSYPSPGSPYTPADSPSGQSPCLSKSFEQDMFLHSTIDDFLLDFDDSGFYDTLCGNISQNASADRYIPINEMLAQSETTSTDRPLAVVASSLTGWNGEDPPGTQTSSYTLSPPSSSKDMVEYRHRNILEQPSFDEYVLGLPPPPIGGMSPINKELQNNLNAYALGLNEYGIGFNRSRFNLTSSAPRR